MSGLRVLIQEKDESGEFHTIKDNKDICGVIFDKGKPAAIITGSTNDMISASGILVGYAVGREDTMAQTKIVKVGGSDA